MYRGLKHSPLDASKPFLHNNLRFQNKKLISFRGFTSSSQTLLFYYFYNQTNPFNIKSAPTTFTQLAKVPSRYVSSSHAAKTYIRFLSVMLIKYPATTNSSSALSQQQIFASFFSTNSF
jgi:hypothetical protein